MNNIENKINELNEKHTAQKKLIDAVLDKNVLLHSKLKTYDNSISLVLNNNVLGHMLKDMLKNEDVQTRIKTWITEDITNRQDELMQAVQELRAEGVADLVERVEELENIDYVYDNEGGIEDLINNYIDYSCDYVEKYEVEKMIEDAVHTAITEHDGEALLETIHREQERERRHTHDYLKSVIIKNTLSYKVKKKLKGLRVVWYNFKNKVRFKRLRTILNLSKLNGKQLEELQVKQTETKKEPAKKAS